ncbi:MAG TPA: TonB-dependent receptor [Vicinamibacterales bacterium]|nr:TonB-dependent receptor [Vicinamibacterales bacterium]
MIRLWSRWAIAALFVFGTALPALAQSQAINGSIEGTVKDTTGAALPGVTVTVTNTDTGAQRVVISGDEGAYRAPLLPLGRYDVVAELQGFKKFEQKGITLSAGQTAVINVALSVGSVSETITVTGESAIANPGKIDLGRTIGENEVKNLPLVSRNPYNFAFLQANVTGYENNEFGVPRINANGSQMHTNYQLDGNTNTEKDRAGLRMLPVSEVLVREVKLITNGFAPEFGQTTGMVYNAITPSGTNNLHGSASFRFKRNPFSEKPFFLAAGARKPDTEANDLTAALGGPIRRDKIHFYGAYEYVDRSLVTGGQVITVTPANAAALGITLPASGVIPAHQKVNFAFGKTDYQINTANALAVRYFLFKNFSASNIGGGLTTTDRATDFTDRMDSASAQLVSTIGRSMLNELRVQYARRHQFRTQGTSVDGPAVTVTGVAAFGGARLGDGNSVGFDFNQGITQVIDNLSWLHGNHGLKAGLDAQYIADTRERGEQFIYTFPSNAAYLDAKSGQSPLGYTTLQQLFGNRAADYNSAFYGLFAQDDWQVSAQLKLLYGIRYDVFDVPSARPFAANKYSQDFAIDKNNFGPRAGLSWAIDASAHTVVRASTGLMYEPPLLDFYDNAILNNGDPASFTVSVPGTGAGAPPFPASLANVPSTFVLPRQSITVVDPDFKTQSAWLSNIQIERALNNDLAVSAGYVNSIGRNLPVLIDVNLVPSGATLPDGRPIYSTAVSSATRVDPTFNQVNMFKSIGESTYNAFTATMTKRMTHGWMAQATYTLARGEDSAPLTGTYVVGSQDDRVSDPSNLERDLGVTPFNQTHTFSLSTVIAPQVSDTTAGAALWNNNQVGIILQANSGLPFNVRAVTDLNGDGVTNDRPNGVERNAGRLGRVLNLDLRYSRFIPIRGAQRAELFFEAKNLFNTENIAGVNRVVPTDASGNPTTAISFRGADYPVAGKSGYDQRLIQLGFKYSF